MFHSRGKLMDDPDALLAGVDTSETQTQNETNDDYDEDYEQDNVEEN